MRDWARAPCGSGAMPNPSQGKTQKHMNQKGFFTWAGGTDTGVAQLPAAQDPWNWKPTSNKSGGKLVGRPDAADVRRRATNTVGVG